MTTAEHRQRIADIAAAGKDALVDVMLDGRPPAEKMVLLGFQITQDDDGEAIGDCLVIDLELNRWAADARHVIPAVPAQ